MMNNKAYKQIYVNDNCIVDFTQTDAIESDVAAGKKFYDNKGNIVSGSANIPTFGGSMPATLDWYEDGNAYWAEGECNIIIPEGVKHLRRYALLQNGVGGCYNIYLPDSLESIKCGTEGPFAGASGNYAKFNLYTNNLDLYIKETLTAYTNTGIDYYQGGYLYVPTFRDKAGNLIKEIKIPDGIKAIPSGWFPKFWSYTENYTYENYKLILPESIENIYDSMSDYGNFLPYLIEINAQTPPSLQDTSFSSKDNPSELTIIVPNGCLDVYTNSSTNWCNFSYAMIEKDAPTTWNIGDETFTVNGNITWEDYITSENNNGAFTIQDGFVYYNDAQIKQFIDFSNDYYPVVSYTYIKNTEYSIEEA